MQQVLNEIYVGNAMFRMFGNKRQLPLQVEHDCYTSILNTLNARDIPSHHSSSAVGFSSVATAYSNGSVWMVDGRTGLTYNTTKARVLLAKGLKTLVEMTNEDGSPFLTSTPRIITDSRLTPEQHRQLSAPDILKCPLETEVDGVEIPEEERVYTYVFNKRWIRCIWIEIVRALVDAKANANSNDFARAIHVLHRDEETRITFNIETDSVLFTQE